MAAPPPNTGKGQNSGGLPPRRGRVKAQIFESLAGNLSAAASKAGQLIVKIGGGGSGGSSGSAASPPSSTYNSDE